ncbi:MAG TPA: S8 family peptidase [Polyangia bacterium]
MKSRMAPVVVLAGACVGTAWLWHGRSVLSSERKAAESEAISADEMARAAAGPDGRPALLVDYRDDVTDADLAATPEVEEPISRFSARDRLYRVHFPSLQAAAAAAERLGHDPRVESVGWDVEASIPPGEDAQEIAAPQHDSMQEECGATSAAAAPAEPSRQGFPSDPCYRYQWHLRQVGLPTAWKLGQGEGAVVAVIDTGVSRVPDLAQAKFVPGYNFVADNDNASDDHGHGTHVAGTIAQSTDNRLGVGGVAFKATIMPLKVLSARGSGSMAGIAQAIRFAADNGAQVINMSLGGPFPVGAIGSAVKYARSKGVTVLAAAGNDGHGKVGYPARYPGVIAVAATQFDGSTTFYSNWGPQVDLAAPGGNTRVDQNGDGKPDGVLQNTIVPGNISKTDYLWFMGTSMATPHAAGVAALIVGAGVTKPDAVEEILLETARKPPPRTSAISLGADPELGDATGGARIDDHYGAGIIDAQGALKKVRGSRGVGELGLALSLAFAGLSSLARRGRGRGTRLGGGFAAALVLGSSGLFVLPWLAGGAGAFGSVVDVASNGALGAVDALLGSTWRGTALVWSALLPVGLAAVFYGVPRLRGALSGLAFGVGGALLFAAIAGAFDVRFMPDLLDRAWLVVNAAACAALGTTILRR